MHALDYDVHMKRNKHKSIFRHDCITFNCLSLNEFSFTRDNSIITSVEGYESLSLFFKYGGCLFLWDWLKGFVVGLLLYFIILTPMKSTSKLVNMSNPQASSSRRWYQLRNVAGGFRKCAPLCLNTYSIHHTAVIRWSCGRSRYSPESLIAFFLYLHQQRLMKI